jgi:hypothetical protein
MLFIFLALGTCFVLVKSDDCGLSYVSPRQCANVNIESIPELDQLLSSVTPFMQTPAKSWFYSHNDRHRTPNQRYCDNELCRKASLLSNERGALAVGVVAGEDIRLVRNWVFSMRRAGIHFMLVCVDTFAFKSVQDFAHSEAVIAPQSMHMPSFNKSASYKTKSWSSLMMKVPQIILLLLQNGFSVLYVDTDISMKYDILSAAQRVSDLTASDFLPQIDGEVSRDSPLECNLEYDRDGTPRGKACGGLAFYRAGMKTISFVKLWIDILNRCSDERKNQASYNRAIMHMMWKNRLRTIPLDCSLHPNGFRVNPEHGGKWWLPSQPYPPALVHANWVRGNNDKVALLKMTSFWNSSGRSSISDGFNWHTEECQVLSQPCCEAKPWSKVCRHSKSILCQSGNDDALSKAFALKETIREFRKSELNEFDHFIFVESDFCAGFGHALHVHSLGVALSLQVEAIHIHAPLLNRRRGGHGLHENLASEETSRDIEQLLGIDAFSPSFDSVREHYGRHLEVIDITKRCDEYGLMKSKREFAKPEFRGLPVEEVKEAFRRMAKRYANSSTTSRRAIVVRMCGYGLGESRGYLNETAWWYRGRLSASISQQFEMQEKDSTPTSKTSPVVVSVHIRRGDFLLPGYTKRLTPDHFFSNAVCNVMTNIQEIDTQIKFKVIVISESHPHRKSDNYTNSLGQEFDIEYYMKKSGCHGVQYEVLLNIDTGVVESFKNLITADVGIYDFASGFSRVAAMYSRTIKIANLNDGHSGMGSNNDSEAYLNLINAKRDGTFDDTVFKAVWEKQNDCLNDCRAH